MNQENLRIAITCIKFKLNINSKDIIFNNKLLNI